MDEQLLKLISEEAAIVTSTQRLSRHLRFQYAKYQLAAGRTAWKTPDILPWTAWCRRTGQSVLFSSGVKLSLLNPVQQHWLWQEIIDASKYGRNLLQTGATARYVAGAYHLCMEWRIPIFPAGVYLSEDALAFKNWAAAYARQKQKLQYLDEASLPDFIAANITDRQIKSGPLVFYGFDQITAQQRFLIQALGEKNIQVAAVNSPVNRSACYVNSFSNTDDEYIAAAVWAKTVLETEPAASIGIVTPQLDMNREAIERQFESVFAPGYPIQDGIKKSGIYSVSLGKSLLTYPMISAAMELLSLSKRRVSLNTLGRLLHSPFIKAARAEQAQRANFYSVLRKTGEQGLSFKTLYRLHGEHCPKHKQCRSFIRLLKSFERDVPDRPETLTLTEWTSRFSQWLTVCGWPGERELNSHEYQTLEAWQAALSRLATLDNVGRPVGFNTALYHLHQTLVETRFQPESPETPVQILGLTGAAAMRFDYIRVLNMQDDVWPNPSPSNPFIPAVCQREYRVPTADPESRLLQAQQITDGLIRSCKEIVFSYVVRDGDRECRPSPLLKAGIKNEPDDHLAAYVDFKQSIMASSKRESFIDTRAPAIAKGATASGGSALFKDQAACPFKAFARHRLHAQTLQPVDIGLSALERGNLAHRSLQLLWQRLNDYATLDCKSTTELESLVETVVSTAIEYQMKQQPETFTARFTELERRRLKRLLIDWLAVERARNDFTLIATEQRQTVVFQDLELQLRIDRIDELADGRYVIIDYKTGAVSKTDWQSGRLKEPQLPLYAITGDRQVAAIAYAGLKRGKLGFVGLAETENILPNVKPDQALSWPEQMESWRQTLTQLADDFRGGAAAVEPTTTACRYCDLHSLCRIYARLDNLNELDAEQGAFDE